MIRTCHKYVWILIAHPKLTGLRFLEGYLLYKYESGIWSIVDLTNLNDVKGQPMIRTWYKIDKIQVHNGAKQFPNKN